MVIDDELGWIWLALTEEAVSAMQLIMNHQSCAILAPVAEVDVDRLPSGKVWRQGPPLSAFDQYIHQDIKQRPQVYAAGATTWFDRGNHFVKRGKLVGGEIARICCSHIALSYAVF